MNAFARRKRAAATLAAAGLSVAALAGGALTAPAGAAPARTATTSTDTTYLQDTLGVPTNTVIETVTYDRFQWLLQQSGKFAFLIGDPVEDSTFKAKAVAVDAAARAAGVKKVYWFDPNLTGGATINGTQLPNLDIRNASAINLASASQAVYDRAWTSLVGQYLGNGLSVTTGNVDSENAYAKVSADADVVNDANAPLYDYSSGTPTNAQDSTFFVYDKDHTAGSPAQPDKLVTSVDLDTSSAVSGDVSAAITASGASAIAAVGQFDWWKSEINAKDAVQSSPEADNPNQYGGAVLDDSDNSDPWAVQQITLPELVHLLDQKASASQNFVILFGGTWCPNTRAVIKKVNQQAQKNDVTVYNFDTVLDGGTVGGTDTGKTIPGGSTTSAADPFQVRNTVNNGTTAANANPTYVYGALLSTYFKNIVTQYDNGTYVTYYPNGDTSKGVSAVRKLQVPFLLDYQRGTANTVSSTAIKRQWIQQNVDSSTGLPTFKEYMTNWRYTNEDTANTRLGLKNADFPLSIKTIPGLANFDWRNPVYPDITSATTDAAAYQTPDEIKAGDTSQVIARKNTILNALAQVAFAREATDKLTYFFGGLPGGVSTTQTVTAPVVAYGTAPKVTVAIANDYGRVPTGKVTLTVNGQSIQQTVTANAASFTLPALAPGSYAYTLTYPGDDQILGFSRTGTVQVTQGTVASVTAKAKKVPTTKKAGAETVTVASPAGGAVATGKVTVTLKKGSAKKKASATLKNGAAKVKLPKLAKGTWKVKLAYAGDANYGAAAGTGAAVKVTK